MGGYYAWLGRANSHDSGCSMITVLSQPLFYLLTLSHLPSNTHNCFWALGHPPKSETGKLSSGIQKKQEVQVQNQPLL